MPSIMVPTLCEGDVREFVLEAREAEVRVGDRPVRLYTYGGELPGPTLHAREGERVRLVFHNRLPEPSNVHLHGMHMPPAVDDPHRVAAPGASLSYEFTIPEGAAGTYWYHPHVHGEVAWQLGAGLAGAMVVTGPDDAEAPLAAADARVLVLQDLALAGDRPRPRTALEMHDGREGELVLVNGESAPSFEVAAGLVRLRLINASGARFYDVALEGAELVLLGLDAGLLERPVPVSSVLLPPGQRADVLIRATGSGPLVLHDLPYDRGVVRLPGARGTPRPNDGVLATFNVHGCARAVPLPARLRPVERLDPARASVTRKLVYGGDGSMWRMVMEMVTRKRYGAGAGDRGPVKFWFNGKPFDAHRVDHEVMLGSVEVWEIHNPTPLDHPFHLHIYPFQVLDIDGEPPPFLAWRDVVNVPAGSTARIAVAFRDFAGTTMFHCHILEHEDNGMMAHIRVVDPAAPAAGRLCGH